VIPALPLPTLISLLLSLYRGLVVDLDLEQFRLPTDQAASVKPPRRPPRHKAGERFLKGPIPWGWLEKAMGLPGKAIHVALHLWRESGWQKQRTVRLRLRGELPSGLNRWAARRGLRALEGAGLVKVTRRPGRALEVTLLD
jgi:hypothetical protein